MSETTTGDGPLVTEAPGGGVFIDELGERVYVGPADRAAVALALLGRSMEELVERGARALHGDESRNGPYDALGEPTQAMLRAMAHRVLAAIVGERSGR
jgi:hypothetical protein